MASDKFEIEDSTGYLINAAARLMAKSLHQRIIEHGVPIGQWPFLMFLWQQDGITQTELSRLIGIDGTTTVRTLDRMEKGELIERFRSKSDRRKIKVLLTEKGRQLQPLLTPFAVEVNAQVTKGLTADEKRSLNNFLRHLIEHAQIDLEEFAGKENQTNQSN